MTVERIQLFTANAATVGICDLAVLAWRAFRSSSVRPVKGVGYQRNVLLALAAFYAVSDEVHQSSSTRYASGWDVLIDMAGAALG
ncbi:MAG: VanZ family protein [Verrucomicrobiota bacterium]